MTAMDQQTSDELRLILTIEEPLGPSNSENINGWGRASDVLFEKQNDIFIKLMKQSGILVGRRGSGKTAFLKQLHAQPNCKFCVFLNASDVFPEIIRTIDTVLPSSGVFVETVHALWDRLVWMCIFKQIVDSLSLLDAKVQILRDYLNWLGVVHNDGPESVIYAALARIKDQVEKGFVVDSEKRIDLALKYNGKEYSEVLRAAKDIMDSHRSGGKTPALVLMDTLEDYRPDIDGAPLAIAGLLRYLGKQSANTKYVNLRFCLPTELYVLFQEVSSNPSKDFHSQTLLHWHAGDLLRIVAHRLSLYLQLYEPERAEALTRRFDINRRDGAHGFLEQFLPAQIVHPNGQHESPLAYILRHTQLLPRHAIQAFNRFLSSAVDPESGALGGILETTIVSGTREEARNTIQSISQAYKYQYPHLIPICSEALVELPIRFKEFDLHRVFNQHAKAVIKRLRDNGKDVSDDTFVGFKRMLIEVGAIGRQIGETTAYWEAEFEYAIASHLNTSSTDDLCLHPLFIERYSSRRSGQFDHKGIYPYGSDPRRDEGRR